MLKMEFIDELFVDKKIKDIETVIYSLKKGIPVYNIYIIYIEEKNKNMAEIMSSFDFCKKETESYRVIGLASGKAGANKLFSSIIEFWISSGNELRDFKEGII